MVIISPFHRFSKLPQSRCVRCYTIYKFVTGFLFHCKCCCRHRRRYCYYYAAGSKAAASSAKNKMHRTNSLVTIHEQGGHAQLSLLMKALFDILEPREQMNPKDAASVRRYAAMMQKRKEDKSLEAGLRKDVRKDALKLVLRCFNARLDTRISYCVQLWENIFEAFENANKIQTLSSQKILLASSVTSMSMDSSRANFDGNTDPEVLRATFGEYNKEIELLINKCFKTNIVSPPEVGSDVYQPDTHDDNTIEIMLDLSTFEDKSLTTRALSLLLRNMSQRFALVENLKEAQLLVYPLAAKVYSECGFVIRRFSG